MQADSDCNRPAGLVNRRLPLTGGVTLDVCRKLPQEPRQLLEILLFPPREYRPPDPFPWGVHGIGHGLALWHRDRFPHATVLGAFLTLDQAYPLQLRNLPADGRVVASNRSARSTTPIGPSRSMPTNSGNKARSSDMPVSRTIASSRCGRLMTLTLLISALCNARSCIKLLRFP
jgi:hypothetical protein